MSFDISLSQETLNDEYDNLLNNPVYIDINPCLLKRQVELESTMRTQGLQRELNNNERAVQISMEANTSYGTRLLKQYIHPVSKAISHLLSSLSSGKAGSNRSSLRHITDLEPQVIAYLTLKTVIDMLSDQKPMSLQNVGFKIGHSLENESRCRLFQAYARRQYEMGVRKLKERGRKRGVEKSHEAFFALMTKAAQGFYGAEPNPDLVWEHWPRSDTARIGVELITLVAETTGLFVIEKKIQENTDKKASMYYVSPSKDLMDWVKDWAYKTGLMSPVFLPAVIPPKPYTNPFDGGYHASFSKRINLVKSKDKAYFKSISKPKVIKNMAPVYNAVNTAASTAWKINTQVLDVLTELWRKEIEVDCLPLQRDLPKPPCPRCGKPVDIDHPCLDDKDIKKLYMQQLKEMHAMNAANRSNTLAVLKILWIAEMFRNDKAIYFPYQLDFRGRIYALPNFLNPQGSDIAKGLLTFSQGKPLGSQEAANWLAVHVANTYGNDKLSFADRIKWVHDNTDMICAVASDPIGNRSLWTRTDSPFCFLAACFEWAGYVREGLSFVSHLPVALDGTCSGLQHYSAMLRDSTGGRHVNLLPSEKPSDIYAEVARVTITKVRERITEIEAMQERDEQAVYDYDMGMKWLESGIIDRKLTKRAVMTLPYGVTFYSAKEYILNRIQELAHDKTKSLPWVQVVDAATLEEFNRLAVEEGVSIGKAGRLVNPVVAAGHWISPFIWAAIYDVVQSARDGMDWLKACASRVAASGKPLSWVAPSGFVVMQAYTQLKARRIVTTFAGAAVYSLDGNKRTVETEAGPQVRVDLTLNEDTDTLDRNRQRTGIAPNFVHSLDASALVFAVNSAHTQDGIDSFALIHDSFGTHASDTPALARAIRESFVAMYQEHDVLSEFRQNILNVLKGVDPSEIPEPPAKGDLDLNAVLDSPYFFS